jgi:response regulator RpfG family c-di-GMP phosphodiesterase
MIAREIPAFEEAEELIRYHHDWYDGTHASKAHSGEEIPLGARIIAIADSYDVLSMANGEASLICDPKAVQALQAMGGRQLDPELLQVFLDIMGAEREAQTTGAGFTLPALAERTVSR